MEANLEPNKNYLYEIITTRINVKISTIFNDDHLLKRIEIISMKTL